MTSSNAQSNWLGLSEASHLLGVHFTTLRRWADAGQVPSIRTPGGRRRFQRGDLERFLAELRPTVGTNLPALLQGRAVDLARQHMQAQAAEAGAWLSRLDDEQRGQFRKRSHQLMALLIQFSSRTNSVDAFLLEGRRLAQQNGLACRNAGLTVAETVSAFLFFRRSMLDAVHDTGVRTGTDAEGQRIYHRMRDFLDALLVATVEGYCAAAVATIEAPQERD